MVEKRIMKKKLELSVIAILVSPVIFSGCDFPNRPVSRYEIDSRPASHEDAGILIVLNQAIELFHNGHDEKALSLQQYDQAIKAFGQAIVVSPESPIAYAGRSRVWLALKETDRAKTDLDQAFCFDPAPEDRACMIELKEQILNFKAGT